MPFKSRDPDVFRLEMKQYFRNAYLAFYAVLDIGYYI